MSKKILIVGGVAGGATAATRLRRLDEEATIIMFERGEYVSFANCGLPYHIGEVIKARNSLVVTTKETFWERYRVEVRTESEVVAIQPESKEITVRIPDGSEYTESYDELILSPGAMPLTPPIPGINHERIKKLRNIPDMDKIKEIVDKNIKSCAVIGGGFIGIEVAENLIERGMQVTLIEAAPHVMAPLDTEISMICEKEMRDNGIELILNDGVKSFTEIPGGIRTETASGLQVDADLVVAAIGVRPDTAFLKNSGIELNQRGYIKVDRQMKTSIEHIWAAGDAIETIDSVTGDPASIALAGPANRQARIIADNIMGMERTYSGSQGTSIIQIFDLVAASTGNNERQLKMKGIEHSVYYIHPFSHATYYPGALQFTAKIIVSAEGGRLLGAQAVGYDGVDKFIDVLATVIGMKGTYKDLTELDLAYAPPFSSAKSPANFAGFTAQNDLEGLVKSKTFTEFESEFNPSTDLILDVREEIEFENDPLKGAINIPLNHLRDRISEIPAGKRIWAYCSIGLRGYTANRVLLQHGFEAFNIAGGTRMLALAKVEDTNLGARRGKADVVTTHEDGTEIIVNEKNEMNEKADKTDHSQTTLEVDACGMACPGPLMRLKDGMDQINSGEILHIRASDPGFYADIQAWARRTGNEVISLSKAKGMVDARLKKAGVLETCDVPVDPTCRTEKNKTLVVFSGDLDKAIASFIIANGAAAMGGKVTMFFTFWGINILRKENPNRVQKTFVEKMFGKMMPRGPQKLKLSNMNMAGIGPAMIKRLMMKKNVDSLESLMVQAQKNGVELVACQMSLDLLGLKAEELIDGVNLGGVGYYLGEAEEAAVNLFI